MLIIAPMSLEKVIGYFTIERHILNADVGEITQKLGFPPNYLLHGARILVIVDRVEVGEFLFAGSTWYPMRTETQRDWFHATNVGTSRSLVLGWVSVSSKSTRS